MEDGAYGEKEVDDIHQDKNEVANAGIAISVGPVHQGDGDKVVGEHLPVVLAALLDVDDQHLLNPECQLRQHVALHEAADLTVGPVGPELSEIPEVRGVAIDVLQCR